MIDDKKDAEQYSNGNFPILVADPFSSFVEASMTWIKLFRLDIHEDILQWVRVFWTLHIVKCVVTLMDSVLIQKDSWPHPKSCLDEENILKFCNWIALKCGMISEDAEEWAKVIGTGTILQSCKSLSVSFLRKTLLLLHIRFGFVLNDDFTTQGGDELSNMISVLGLASIEHLLSPSTISDPFLSTLITGWCSHAQKKQIFEYSMESAGEKDPSKRQFCFYTPVQYSLTTLPYRLETLFEESIKHKCAKCGLVPLEPGLCLICGVLVCSQSYCCSDEDRGECNLHMLSCGGKVGMYLLIKKSCILILSHDNGHFMNPPYLDAHGEVDLGLK